VTQATFINKGATMAKKEEKKEETLQHEADLEFFDSDDAGIVLTDEQLLAIHGGSCHATGPSCW
jgi:hypothetical protein